MISEKVMVTIAPHTLPVQQLCRPDLRPKYGPSAHWAAKNAKLSEAEQRYMVQVLNFLSENGVPTTKKVISIVITVCLLVLLAFSEFYNLH